MFATSRQRLPAARRETWLGWSNVTLGALWLLLALGEDGRGQHFRFVSAGVWLLLGISYLTLGRTSLTAEGLRPAGRLRHVLWGQITTMYVTSRPDRRRQVALMIRDERTPVWIHDPQRLVLHRWGAETGRQAASYGASGPSGRLDQ